MGSSGHGKSTLVAELIRTATYYSDEYAAIDEQGRVLSPIRELYCSGKAAPTSVRLRRPRISGGSPTAPPKSASSSIFPIKTVPRPAWTQSAKARGCGCCWRTRRTCWRIPQGAVQKIYRE